MYPEGTTMIYSNFTPRKSRIKGVDHVVFFGLQHFCLEYLIKAFNEDFFGHQTHAKTGNHYQLFKKEVIEEYKRHIPVDTTHIEALWDLGYLPIEIKAVPEGTLVPIGVPCFTIKNTHPDFAWLTNYLETLISCMMWQPITSATIAYEYKKLLAKYALETTGSTDFVQWQGHDFSMRGMSSVESAILSGMGHLLSFTGTDTIPAIYTLEKSYFATDLIGASVPATEHSVMCMGTKEGELDTLKRLLKLYPTGILSVVYDTWDLFGGLKKVGEDKELVAEIKARDGKLVFRPDSGDPVDILCGLEMESFDSLEDAKDSFSDTLTCNQTHGECSFEIPEHTTVKVKDKVYHLTADVEWNRYDKQYYFIETLKIDAAETTLLPKDLGVVELLWDIFGGTIHIGNDGKEYKLLDSHIGAIYGDSITLDRADDICKRLRAKGFASTNVVLGIGSYTYQYNTRDTFGFAMKATYGEVLERVESTTQWISVGREIFKDPITDDGTKKSKKGLLRVDAYDRDAKQLYVKDQCTWDEEKGGLLQTVFKDGKMIKTTTLEEIRAKLAV